MDLIQGERSWQGKQRVSMRWTNRNLAAIAIVAVSWVVKGLY